MGIRRSIVKGIEASGDLIQQNTAVHGVRNGIYQRKAEIAQTPMMRDIVHSAIGDFSHPPLRIEIISSGIMSRPYDPASGTYHPNGIMAYTPEVVFDYEVACAICLIIQDIYPGVYDLPNVSIVELNNQLQFGTWSTKLILKREYMNKPIAPKFNIDDIATMPFDQLPMQFDDPKNKKYRKLPTVSLVLGIISLALSWTMFGNMLISIAGLITGIIGLKTTDKKGKCIAGIIMNILGGFVLPIIIAIISFFSWINSGFGLF